MQIDAIDGHLGGLAANRYPVNWGGLRPRQRWLILFSVDYVPLLGEPGNPLDNFTSHRADAG
jgi:hypothetical protein